MLIDKFDKIKSMENQADQLSAARLKFILDYGLNLRGDILDQFENYRMRDEALMNLIVEYSTLAQKEKDQEKENFPIFRIPG